MSELPEEHDQTPARGAKEDAWTSVNDAQASWSGAMRAHEQAPPDPGFRDRLRALAEAAAAMRDAHARALQAGTGVAARRRLRTRPSAHELRPGTGRRGPRQLWARFDTAVQQLNQAGARDNLTDVVDAYAALAQAASELANALEAAGE